METLFTIQEQLPEGCKVRGFNLDNELELTNITVMTEGALTLELSNRLVTIFQDNLSDFNLSGNVENGQLSARVE